MDMNTRDTVMKKLLDAQENVRDYEMFSKKVKDQEVADTFKQFAEESGKQARKLQELIDKYDRH
jgi:rubrerythrin